jgi:two-component system sensor histidine kinase TtrS
VRDLYRRLRMGPYAYLRENTPKAIFLRYRVLILSALGALVLALLYIVSVRRIVRVRTHALEVALREKDRAQERERKSREQLFALEKAGAVSGLSAMFAHEVRQPIASLVNYAGGLKMYLRDKTDDPMVNEALSEISEQSERISDIVGRVCSYAKNEKSVRVQGDLADVAARAEAVFSKSSPARGVALENDVRGPAPCLMDPLEIELVLVNLLRNAGTAAKAGPDPAPHVRMTLGRAGDFWVISVEDSGAYVSDEAMKRLAHPVRSEKKEGLGLGLTICRIIAEGHGGHLSFGRSDPHGLRASLHLPVSLGKGGETS